MQQVTVRTASSRDTHIRDMHGMDIHNRDIYTERIYTSGTNGASSSQLLTASHGEEGAVHSTRITPHQTSLSASLVR